MEEQRQEVRRRCEVELRVFAGLPLGLRLMRIERGRTAAEMDLLLGYRGPVFRAWEEGRIEPLLGELDRALTILDVDVFGLEQVLTSVRSIPWPARESFPRRSAEQFLSARQVIQWLRGTSPAEEAGFDSFAEALVWLRRFFGFDEEQLAAIIGRTVETIRALEAGRRGPSSSTRSELAWSLEPHFDQRLARAEHLGLRPLLGRGGFRGPEAAEHGTAETER